MLTETFPLTINREDRRLPLFAAAMLALAITALASPRQLPPEELFKHAGLGACQLSPDGAYLAMLRPGVTSARFTVLHLDTGRKTIIGNKWLESVYWVNNERLLLEELNGSILSVRRDGTAARRLLESPWHRMFQGKDPYLDVHEILAVHLANSDEEVLVEKYRVWPGVRRVYPDVHRLNVVTGKLTLEEKNPGYVLAWVTDAEGVLRAAVAVEKKLVKILYRPRKGQPWKVLRQSSLLETDLLPVAIEPDTQHLMVAALGSKKRLGLFTFDPEAGNICQSVWQHDEVDLCSLLPRRPLGGSLRALGYETERLRFHWLTSEGAAAQQRVDRAFPDRVNILANASADGKRYFCLSCSDRVPCEYFLLDTRSNLLVNLGKALDVDPDDLAPTQPISYLARDGLRIHGYLTRPLGASNNLPLVAMPHGGPWTRDHWEFDPEVQFLANRGYAVLQMNFRGSSGYGLDFLKAGFRQWGLKMQDDITDAVKWVIEQGIADPHRIAIFGESYGGYAALMGLISTPELYRCGISYAGVTDVRSWLKSSYRFRSRSTARLFDRIMIGDFRDNEEDLDAVSPLNHVEDIRVPVLLAYGTADRIVPREQGDQMVKALKKAHKPYECIVKEYEGHGFRLGTNRIELFNRIDAFLKENLK